MAVSKYFDQFLSTKPSLHELTEHIRVSSKWYSLGVLLKLDAKKLEGIRAKNEDSTFKLIKMFQLWLMTNPNATRREIIEALQNDAISEHAIAEKYEKSFKKDITESSADHDESAVVNVSTTQEALPTFVTEKSISESTLMKESDDTTRLQPMSISSPDDNMYVAQVVYEHLDDRQWLMRFIVGKHLDSVLKYMETRLPPNVEKDVFTSFTFQDSNGFIELVFNEKQNHPYNGWRIFPHFVPLRIYKCDIDSLGVEVPPSCPYMAVTVSADERPDTVTRLNYCVLLSGIKSDNKMIHIVRSLDNSITDYTSLLHNALKEGRIRCKYSKLSVSGAPGTGKSSVLKLLLNLPPPYCHHSTPVATAPEVRRVETMSLIAGTNPFFNGQIWEKIDTQYMKRVIAKTIKVGIQSSLADYTTQYEEDIDSSDDDNSSLEDTSPDRNEVMSVSPSKVLALPVSVVANEIAEIMPTVKESPELFNSHWIYCVDSGGQAAFLDIAPAILRYSPVNIFTQKLNEKLDDKPKFFFSLKGQQIGAPVEHQITNLQLLESSFRSLASIDQPDLLKIHITFSHAEPSFVILGTFFDKVIECVGESLQEKNLRLWSTLSQFRGMHMNYHEAKKEIIFPINTTARGEFEMKIAERIRTIVCQSYIEAEIPVRWFLFKLELEKFQNITKSMVISKRECLRIGLTLQMDRKDIEASLLYYHDLTIFLYFPAVLPDIVFLHPQPLFSKLSEVISISFADSVTYLEEMNIVLPSYVRFQLKAEGIFARELLDFLSDGFSPDFTADDFLKLMENIFVIVPLPEKDNIRSPFMKNMDAFVLTWDEKPIPQGLFPALVIGLLKRRASPCFSLHQPLEYEMQYRNAIRLTCISLGGAVLLVDAFYWMEVYYSGPPMKCSVIKDAIFEAITNVVKKFQYKPFLSRPQECFLCSICPPPTDHLCYSDENKKILTCCKDGMSTKFIDRARQLPWIYKEQFDNLKDMCIGGDKSFRIHGDSPLFLNWEKYGLRVIVSQGTLSPRDTCKVTLTALVGGQFQFPEGIELISAVYDISVSKPLLKPINLQMQHCANLVNENHTFYLSFATASVEKKTLSYQFQLENGGQFWPGDQYGSIVLTRYCLIAIVKSHSDPLWCSNAFMSQPNNAIGDSAYNSPVITSDVIDKIKCLPTTSGNDKKALSVETVTESTSETCLQPTQLMDVLSSTANLVKDECSLSNFPDNRYIGQVAYENGNSSEWLMHFMVAKCLNALVEFMKTSLSPDAKRDAQFYFTFQDCTECIELVLNGEQNQSYDGWNINPHTDPTVIYKTDVDNFGCRSPASVPFILITVSAGPGAVTRLNYCVPLRGIEPDQKIYIIRSLGSYTSNVSGNDCEVARKALVLCTDVIVESTIDPIALARKLYSKLLISENVYKKVRDRACRDTNDERLDYILDDIKDHIKHDANVLTKFVDILRKEMNRDDLANEIMLKLN